jgi:hypothetical protein
MTMTDDGTVTFAPDGSGTFVDQGFMQINLQTLMSGGNPLHVPGGLDGVYLKYTGTGQQTGADIHYDNLDYTLVGYKGSLSFTHDTTTGAAIVVGTPKQTVELAHGGLDSAEYRDLWFAQSSPTALPTVSGELKLSVLTGSNQLTGELDVMLAHSVGEVLPIGGSLPPSGFTLTGGDIHATYIPV